MGVVSRNDAGISVLLASDEPLIRTGLRSLIDAFAGVSVAGECETLAQTERALGSDPADVVVLDTRMESGAGLDAIHRIRRRSPQTSVVVVTSSDRPDSARLALDAGALAYLTKRDGPDDLQAAIEAAAEGREYRQRSLADLLELQPEAIIDREISDRERDVLRLLALGHTNREIARRLYLSVRTVETHRASLLRKLGASSRADLVTYALGHGLVRDVA